MVVVHLPVAFGGSLWLNANFGFWIFPLFGSYLADGYKNTSNPLAYFLRLLVWGAVSQPLYQAYFDTEGINILWMLAGALVAYHFLQSERRSWGPVACRDIWRPAYLFYPAHLAVLLALKLAFTW